MDSSYSLGNFKTVLMPNFRHVITRLFHITR